MAVSIVSKMRKRHFRLTDQPQRSTTWSPVWGQIGNGWRTANTSSDAKCRASADIHPSRGPFLASLIPGRLAWEGYRQPTW